MNPLTLIITLIHYKDTLLILFNFKYYKIYTRVILNSKNIRFIRTNY